MTEPPFTGPFRFGAARQAGLTPGRLRGPGFTRLGRGLYAPAAAPVTLLQRAAAELTFCPPDTLVTGVTALHLYGVAVGEAVPVRAVTATGQRSRRAGVCLARASVLPPDRSRLVVPVAAWLMACVELDLLQAVTAGDWLLRAGHADRTELVTAADLATGRGCVRARRAAARVRHRVDSPRETRLRLALVLAGLPEPECNLTLGTDEHPIGRVDLAYLAYLVLVEYDGDQHRTDRTQWNIDLDRNDAFERHRLLDRTGERGSDASAPGSCCPGARQARRAGLRGPGTTLRRRVGCPLRVERSLGVVARPVRTTSSDHSAYRIVGFPLTRALG